MMINQKPATDEQARARTWVVWDIKSCPVPDECDASRVGSCIKAALRFLGYSGSVTITVFGLLTEVPDNLLQSVSSTGIALCHTPTESRNTGTAMVDWADENPPPANILLLSAVHFFYPLQTLRDMGFNVLPQVFYDYSRDTPATSTQIESRWKKFYGRFLKDSEKECSETSECEWTCRVCANDPINYTDFTAGQGFENFTNHLLSQEHHQNMLDYLTPDLRHSYKEKAKAYRDSHPKNATTSVNNEPKRKCKKQKTSRR